jgi:hypothetical protein
VRRHDSVGDVSRKREQQRENKKELARQLGVAGRAVPPNLLENERVTEPTLGLGLVVDSWSGGGLLARFGIGRPAARRLQLHALLWCVSAHRARLVRSILAHADVDGAGTAAVVVDASSDHGHDVVRYKRPGFFVLLAAVSEGRDGPAAVADQTWLATRLTFTLPSGPVAVEDLGATKSPTAVATDIAGGWGALVVAKPAADRVKETLPLPFTSTDGAVAVKLRVSLRL